jgi:hypothetical protein
MHPRTRNPRRFWPLALLLSTGCDLSVDLSLIRNTDAGSEPGPDVEEDAGEWEADAEEPLPDADVELDASVEPDASDAAADVGPKRDATVRDAQEPDVQAPIIDAQVGCKRDSECAADSFCTAAGACVARCDEQRGCVGPMVPLGAWGIAAVGDTIYWSTPVETDTLGNALNHGRIWSWRRGTALNAVDQRESGTLLFVIDDYIYLRRPASLGGEPTVLMRKSLGTPDAPAEQLATGVSKVWKTRDHVVWSRNEGANQELWRLRRMPASTPERALITADGEWTSSNATFAVKHAGVDPAFHFVIVRLSDQAVHGVVEGGWNEHSAADEDYFYFPRESQIRRVPFSDLSQELILASGGMHVSLRCEPSGGWLYWYAEVGFPTPLGGRTQRDALVPPQALSNAPPYAAVIKNELVYVDYIGDYEPRIVIKTMPPLPCSSAMPCPADMSCSANMLCE